MVSGSIFLRPRDWAKTNFPHPDSQLNRKSLLGWEVAVLFLVKLLVVRSKVLLYFSWAVYALLKKAVGKGNGGPMNKRYYSILKSALYISAPYRTEIHSS